MLSLIEDPMNATIARLAQEAYAKLTLGGEDQHSIAQIEEKSIWISPAPIFYKDAHLLPPICWGCFQQCICKVGNASKADEVAQMCYY